jgi:peptide/nickel transport system substrate-binding protein
MDNKGKPAWNRRLELKSAGRRTSKTFKKQARKIEGATLRHAHRFLLNRWDKIREVRLHIILWLSGVGLLIALVGVQMLWFQRGYFTDAPKDGGTFAEAVKGPIQTLNPLFATTPAELAVSHLLFSSLYANDTTGHLHGDIAASMKNVGDKVFTVSLRRDVKWHDGKPLTADDITYTVGLMKSSAVRSVNTSSWQGINVRQLDDYTVEFTLPAAYAAFPQALTFSILPQHLLRTADPTKLRESNYSKSPVGSGPFSLRLLQVINQSTGRKIIHMDAYKDYFLGRARIDRLQLHVYADDESLGRALRTGEVNAASGISGRVAEGINADQFDIMNVPVNNGVYALFNMTQPALKDANVRKALLLGTDTVSLRGQLYGQPRPLYLPFVQGQVSGLGDVKPPKYDKQAAINLLDSSGWTKQNGVRMKGSDRLHLKLVARKNSEYESILQTLAGQWRQIGVEIDAQVVDPANFTQLVLHDRDYDVLVDQLVIGGDPDVFAYWHSRGLLNFTSYANDKSDDALASARTTSDQALRAVKYGTFARQWMEDVPAIGLYQSNLIYAHTKTTHSIAKDEKVVSPDDHYAGVLYWTAEHGTVYKTP